MEDVILWGLAILVVVVLFIALFRSRDNPDDNTPIIDNNCIVATNSVPQLVTKQCCVFTDGTRTPLRIANLQSSSLQFQMVVSPTPINYVQACTGFCTGTINSDDKCSIPNPIFDGCIAITKPNNCRGPAMPVAVDGIKFYYAYSAGTSQCPSTTPCI